jgi:hypothetical protein
MEPTKNLAPGAGAPETAPPMQRTDKQRADVARLLSMARSTDPNFGVDAPGVPEVHLAGPGAEVPEEEDDEGSAEGQPRPLADDETDPAAEAALAAASGGAPPPRPAQRPVAPEGPRVGIPEWFVLPSGFEAEMPQGVEACFLKLEARHTYRPSFGDRQCLLLPLTVKEETLAYKRIAGLGTSSPQAAISELAKQTIKVIDGKKPEWVKRAARNTPDVFWNDIGRKYRNIIEGWYVKTHVLGKEDRAAFLANCMDVRIVGG